MPRVPDEYLNCIVYMYPSIPAVEKGERLGGTGFVVGVDASHDRSIRFFYVVTNKHVVDSGNTTVRFNTLHGRHEAQEYDESNWLRSIDTDLAIYLLPPLDPRHFDFRPISLGQFITKEMIRKYDIGIGDEVFFAGRFINAEGVDKNRPSLRFGTIAQVSTDVIDGEESFLVEARSIPGYSGSPVFQYTVAGVRNFVIETTPTKGVGTYLLGVDWCHISDYVDAKNERGEILPFKIRNNTGMMGVIPIWKLAELLFRADVRKNRETDPRNIRATGLSAE
jgi:hypothetical protein